MAQLNFDKLKIALNLGKYGDLIEFQEGNMQPSANPRQLSSKEELEEYYPLRY